ncbi:MAG TPA: uridine kinase [Gammaproteobacteria bacterium]|nr:uridine kinase [Gammaproteobacteria bacterium]
MDQQKIIIIGIAGASGSGKSLLANTIVRELGSDQVAVISEDSYYKDHSDIPFDDRAKINYDHPDALDHDLMHQHLTQLLKGESIEVPTYSHSLHIREKETQKIGKHSIIVVEGILLFFEKKIRDLMDIRIYMDTSLDICLIRRLRRDIHERGRTIESVLQQYEETVRPMYLQFIEPSKRLADIIVPRGGGNRIAIDMIKAKMRELLNNVHNGTVRVVREKDSF